jgi:hypothetical protein
MVDYGSFLKPLENTARQTSSRDSSANEYLFDMLFSDSHHIKILAFRKLISIYKSEQEDPRIYKFIENLDHVSLVDQKLSSAHSGKGAIRSLINGHSLNAFHNDCNVRSYSPREAHSITKDSILEHCSTSTSMNFTNVILENFAEYLLITPYYLKGRLEKVLRNKRIIETLFKFLDYAELRYNTLILFKVLSYSK